MTFTEPKLGTMPKVSTFKHLSAGWRTRDRFPVLIASIALVIACAVFVTLHVVPVEVEQEPITVPHKYAADFQHDWLDRENITFVLQRDMNTSFFFTEDNYKNGVEAIRSYLEIFETRVRLLFRHLLHVPSCEADLPDIAKWGAGCAVDPSSKPKGKKQVVIDVGSNRGYYSMMSASYGMEVHAFDPQPHCALFVTAGILMNGFTNRLHFRQTYVSTNTSAPMTVRKRTGCSGKFPNDREDGWGPHLQARLRELPGSDEQEDVDGVRLDDLFNGRKHDVALLKIDVEGHEHMVLRSALKLLESGTVRNIVMEVNFPMMRRQADGLGKTARATRRVIRWLMNDLGYASKVSKKGPFSEQAEMTDDEWDDYLDPLNKDMNAEIEVWFYKPEA